MKKTTIVKILILLSFIFLIAHPIQAAGVEGTTIVLNARTWWLMDRLCKWKKRIN